MKLGVIITIIVAALCLIFGGSYFFSHSHQSSQTIPSPIPTTTISTTGTASSTQIPSTPAPSALTELPTKYITAADWPPQERIENQPFHCTGAGSESTAGQTKNMVINGHTYCVTKESEGAAGSVYTKYAYARAKNNGTQIFTFTLRYVQCANYPEPQKTVCDTERQNFNVDTFMDQYIQNK